MDMIGMLYIVHVRMIKKTTKEKVKQRLLMVGCEHKDIARKINWIIDGSKYESVAITDIVKVRQKVHVISTVITQHKEQIGPIISGTENSKYVDQVVPFDRNPSKLYAIGLTTTMSGCSKGHALRKTARALAISTTDEIKSSNEPSLSEDSIIQIEEIPFRSQHVRARDTSSEINPAHVIRNTK